MDREIRSGRNVRYSAFMACYMTAFCIAPGFASVFLLGRGYSNTQVGIIMAVSMVLTMVLQPAIATATDRSKTHTPVYFITLTALAGVVCTVLLLVLPAGELPLAIAFLLFAAIVRGLQPLTNAFAFYLERQGRKVNFGIARGVGSLAYACAAAPLGSLCARHGVGLLPVIGFGALLLMALMAHSCSAGGAHIAAAGGTKTHHSFSEIVHRNPGFMALLIGTMLMLFNTASINVFLLQTAVNVGGDSSNMGALGSFCAIVELPAMFGYSRICKRAAHTALLKICAVFFFVKGLAFFLAGSVPMLFVAMAFHSLSYGLFIPASAHYIDEVMEPADANRGQAFVTAMMSAGNILACVAGGVLIDAVGVSGLHLVSAVACAVGALLIVFGMKRRPVGK